MSTQGNTLKITVEPNSNQDKRTATVTLLTTNNTVMSNISITQCCLPDSEILESTVTKKQTFYPMFTATWCPFSPDMDKSLVEIQKRWKYPILPMRIHVKDSELYTPLSIELSELYDNNTTPTGYFDNYFMVNNVADDNVTVDYFWNTILAMTNSSSNYTDRCSSIGCKTLMNDTDISAEVTITPIERGEYKLLLYILEDSIIKPQMSKTEGEINDYCHNGVLVGALTSLNGQELMLSSFPKTLSITGAIPSNVDKSNIRLLVVLERNDTQLNYTEDCWFADNCLSVPLGKRSGDNVSENIYVGDEIDN